MPQEPSPSRLGWITKAVVFVAVCAISLGAAWWLLRDRIEVSRQGIRLIDQTRTRSPWQPPSTFGERFNTSSDEFDPFVSNDGNEFYFARREGTGFSDIYVSRRTDGAWGTPEKVPGVSTHYDEASPRLTADGRYLLFVSDRPGGVGQYDIWAAERTADGWGPPFNLGSGVNSARDDYSPAPTADGKRLYFSSNRNARGAEEWGGKLRLSVAGNFDVFYTNALEGARLEFGDAATVAGVNSPFHEGPVTVSPDGQWLYFSSNRPGGRGGFDLYRAKLVGVDASAVENLGIAVNSERDDADPALTADGTQLLFSSDRPGTRGEDDLLMSEARPDELPPVEIAKQLPKIGPSGWVLAVTLVLLVPLLNALRSPEARDLLSKCILLSLLLHVLLAMSFSAVHVTRGVMAYVQDGTGEGGASALEVPLNLEASRVAELQLQVRNQLTELPTPTAAVELPRMQTEVEVPIEPPPTLAVQVNSPRMMDPSAMVIRARAPEPPDAPPAEGIVVGTPSIEMVIPDVRVNLPAPVRGAEANAEVAPDRPQGVHMEPNVVAVAAAQTVLGTVPVRPEVEIAGGVTVSTVAPRQAVGGIAPVPDPVGVSVIPNVPEMTLMPRVDLPKVSVAPPVVPPVEPPVGMGSARISSGRPAPPPVVDRRTDLSRPNETRLPVDPVRDSGAGEIAARRGNVIGAAVAPPPPQVAVAPLVGRIGPTFDPKKETLAQRAPEERKTLVEQLGGSRESEEAVARALAWLARNQEPDGRWTNFAGDSTPRPDRVDTNRHDTALTGMAVLCFLASDHTPTKRGPYQEAVRQGLEFLLRTQGRDGDLRGKGNMYSHGIAAMALGEAGMMTGDERYRRAALAAARFCVEAQRVDTGGWQYQPGDFGDTSVVAWQMMALRSAERVGFETPQRTREAAAKWLDRVGAGRYGLLAGYQNNVPSPPMTAQGLFCRVLLGQTLPTAALREATEYISSQPAGTGEKNFYYWYCASLSLMQFQNDAWTRWNLRTREHLVKLQRRGGDADGSFDPDEKWTNQGGRVCSTAFATLTLEVYYRYLPLYAAQGGR